MRLWKNIIHVAGREFVEVAFTPSVSLETMRSVPFVIPTVTTQRKSVFRK
jgi:hypothetical protein